MLRETNIPLLVIVALVAIAVILLCLRALFETANTFDGGGSAAEWAGAVFAGLLFVVSALQLAMFYGQLQAMAQGLRDSAVAAGAAKTSADASIMTERAYLFVELDEPVSINGSTERDPARSRIKFSVKNFGKTPARLGYDVLQDWAFCPDGEVPGVAATAHHNDPVVLAPGQACGLPAITFEISQENLASTAVGPACIWFCGSLGYQDVFNQVHMLTFDAVYHANRPLQLLQQREHDYVPD